MNLEALLERLEVNDCWLWPTASARGYGSVRFNGKKCKPHRVVYESLVGPIPEGRVLDHLCRVKNCVNPDHLEPVTQAVNIERGHRVSPSDTPRTDSVERFLINHPGQHRARDVARALGLDNNQAAVTLYHLEASGRVRRERKKPKGELPYSLWSAT